MPNFKTHLKTGACVGLIAAGLTNYIIQKKLQEKNPDYKFNWENFFLSLFGGATLGSIAGILPDLLEPATDFNHRSFFHSASSCSLIGYGLYKVNQSKGLTAEQKSVASIACLGYLSHLFLDSQTPMGLPLIHSSVV